MPDDAPTQVTRLLGDVRAGRPHATDELLPLLYAELRRLARARVAGEKHRHSVQATSLVHEAWLRLVGDADRGWENRAQFFAAAAEAMRRILIERARRRGRGRHGGNAQRVSLSKVDVAAEPPPEEILALDEVLDRLQEKDPEMARVVKLRYFAGLTVPETAEALHLSPRTVNRQWTAARAWLHRELGGDVAPD